MFSSEDQAVIDKLTFIVSDLESLKEQVKPNAGIDFYRNLCFASRIIEEYKNKHEIALKVGN
jgi:aromatic ring-opening dioxygenase LigB subunit